MIDHSEIQYAYRKEGTRVSVFDVETGDECNCICTLCKKPVGAKNAGKTWDTVLKPNQKSAHFYHINSSDCNGETLIHILAKEVIKESKKIIFVIPTYNSDDEFLSLEHKEVYFDKIILEQRLNLGATYIIPDVTAIIQKKRVYVEIVYRNNLSDSKKKLIIRNKLKFLAINFNVDYINWNEFKTQSDLKAKIKWFLYENELIQQNWISNPKFEDNLPKKIIETEIAHDCNINENDTEIENVPSEWLKIVSEEEKYNKKLEIIAKYLDFNSTDLTQEVLSFEEIGMYFMRDKNYINLNSKIDLKPKYQKELSELRKNNNHDWLRIYEKYGSSA